MDDQQLDDGEAFFLRHGFEFYRHVTTLWRAFSRGAIQRKDVRAGDEHSPRDIADIRQLRLRPCRGSPGKAKSGQSEQDSSLRTCLTPSTPRATSAARSISA
jgi:hypothetical protein